jgi:hypothetical protein
VAQQRRSPPEDRDLWYSSPQRQRVQLSHTALLEGSKQQRRAAPGVQHLACLIGCARTAEVSHSSANQFRVCAPAAIEQGSSFLRGAAAARAAGLFTKQVPALAVSLRQRAHRAGRLGDSSGTRNALQSVQEARAAKRD